MPTIVSFASGKGGVGKSTIVSNLGLLLARRGLEVIVLDLDVGGADQHVMFGELSAKHTLSDFLARRVEKLEDVALRLGVCPRLRLIAGTGETLRSANPAVQTKKRLERHVRALGCDVVLLDIGAGTNYHALDFFLWADVPVVVSTPDPTAVLDLYKFLKLAATRRVLLALGARDPASDLLAFEDFRSLEELLSAAKQSGAETERAARDALESFHPALILNAAAAEDRQSAARLREVIRRFLGTDAELLGRIPADPAVVASIRRFLPVVESNPEAPAARAFAEVEATLSARLRAHGVAAEARF